MRIVYNETKNSSSNVSGVDSSVVACILKERYEVIGITLQLYKSNTEFVNKKHVKRARYI